jgi:hypothetical protein
MTKNIKILYFGFLLVGLGFYSCSKETSEAKAVMEKQISLTESFISATEKAGNAKEATAALNDFSAAWNELAPKITELKEKHPDVYKKEIERSTKKREELTQKLLIAMMLPMQQYPSDPDVKKATELVFSSIVQIKFEPK